TNKRKKSTNLDNEGETLGTQEETSNKERRMEENVNVTSGTQGTSNEKMKENVNVINIQEKSDSLNDEGVLYEGTLDDEYAEILPRAKTTDKKTWH
ncbi:27805_t:CDS:2, partial [Dentiscutata erythropus]